MQILYSLIRARACVLFLIGGPGCGKTALMKQLVAMATADSAFRAGVMASAHAGKVYPAGAPADNVKYMTHKAALKNNIGDPAVTIATAMCNFDWVPDAGNPNEGGLDGGGGFYQKCAAKVAAHVLHALEEVQACVSQLPQFFKQWTTARKTRIPGETPTQMLAACPHVVAMDPLQSSCKNVGVLRVTPAGRVVFEDREVIMPWERIRLGTADPGPQLTWHICLMHDQHRIKGALFRLLKNGCARRFDCCLPTSAALFLY